MAAAGCAATSSGTSISMRSSAAPKGLAEVVGPQRARGAAAERVVHHELERQHVRAS